MAHLHLINIISTISLLAMSILFSHQALAISKGYSAPAQVILKDDVPCFFAKMSKEKPTLAGQTIMVIDHRGTMPTMWQIDERTGIPPLPSNAAQCIKYGTSWQTGVTTTAPKPLQYGVPYFADIETGAGNGASFRVKFCLLEDTNGKPLLTKWAKDGKHCTNRPLSDVDRPGLLEWIFTWAFHSHSSTKTFLMLL